MGCADVLTADGGEGVKFAIVATSSATAFIHPERLSKANQASLMVLLHDIEEKSGSPAKAMVEKCGTGPDQKCFARKGGTPQRRAGITDSSNTAPTRRTGDAATATVDVRTVPQANRRERYRIQ